MTRHVQAVKDYALEHYDEKSWSSVVEAWSDEEIAKEIAGAVSDRMAIYKMNQWVDVHFTYAEDIRNS